MDLIARTFSWLADPVHWAGPNGIPIRLAEHIGLSAASLVIALAIALPVGLWIGHTGRLTWLAVNSANLWRALPSLAVIAMVLPITASLDPQAGFKIYPTAVAMVVLALPPILVNAYAGVAALDRELIEAGRGQGMSPWQLLARVELPLAVPIIVAGIRSGAIQIVATATLGAIFGFGGLGRYLVDGLAQSSRGGDAQMLAGVILVAALVFATELVFATVQRQLTPRAMRLERSGSATQA
jgi:osmoprotectant transport system permease protein